ncbi:hypothetical protein ACGFNP_25530 [Nonomuraea sp. NPDC049269]|uniref:hypothetical protein n=1 Tax=Nonomuraea sp. NPDC049269 TaxID=3364349 RepID=UPI003713C3D6
MAWVRYDDQFHVNPKVTAVIAEDAAALALHVLANTWTNSQKRMGFVPRHQPGVLVCDRTQGTAWAEVLVRHGLWHDRDNDCAACREEYADLPDDVDGFVIHNAKEYRAPARERLTSGTAADLSEKRREAGRRGGLASAARRNQTNESKSKQTEAKRQASQADEAKNEPTASTRAAVAASGTNPQVQVEAAITPPAETQQVAQASQANGVSKTSNLLLAGVSPVPGTSPYGEVPPETLFASDEAKVPPTAGTAKPRRTPPEDAPPNAGDVVAAWVEGAEAVSGERPGGRLIAQVGRQARELLEEGKDPSRLVEAAKAAGRKGFADLPRELLRMGAGGSSDSGKYAPGSEPHLKPGTTYDPEKVI